MKGHSFRNLYKNAVGTVFLLIAAFFVCSTLLSMRVVLADPIAPALVAGTTDVASGRTSVRTNPRGTATVKTRQNNVRGITGRNVAARGNTQNVTSKSDAKVVQTSPNRGVVARSTNKTTIGRGVVSRTKTRTSTRNVRARNADSGASRVSVSGDAIRGSKTTGTSYTYLNKLYSGNYSNILDSSTGLISADAYSTCLDAYYTCMDEICTARNAAQRRCACAGRVKIFAAAEAALESANEELIKVSGELALLIANDGKEVSAAFQLTDAEKVMNCASWREASHNGQAKADVFGDWCEQHGFYDSSECSVSQAPKYCSSTNNGGLFDIANLDGTGSEILSSLAEWADTVKENTNTLLNTDEGSVFEAIADMSDEVGGIIGADISLSEDEVEDSLSQTWGYELFEYAHNNVCSRVLDSCFNGIYEGCGTPPSGGRCANGASSSCPYNYNSKVTVSASGDVTLNERSNSGTSASASCFGYTSSSGDPYSSLRGPVADARRSVMQKYLLDANADCDAYGDELKKTAQKISYQKVAAQQALQQKRLEFYNEEQDKILSDAIAAGTNFNECISELWDCYENQATANPSWPEARIKTYCAQIANVPHCYQDMICNPSYAQFRAIIEVNDNSSCTWHGTDYSQNTCRNIVTLNEILNTTGQTAATSLPADGKTADSAALREKCLQDAMGCGNGGTCVRTWTK